MSPAGRDFDPQPGTPSGGSSFNGRLGLDPGLCLDGGVSAPRTLPATLLRCLPATCSPLATLPMVPHRLGAFVEIAAATALAAEPPFRRRRPRRRSRFPPPLSPSRIRGHALRQRKVCARANSQCSLPLLASACRRPVCASEIRYSAALPSNLASPLHRMLESDRPDIRLARWRVVPRRCW